MSSTIFKSRFQVLKESNCYSDNLIKQIDNIIENNNGTLPKSFIVSDVGRHELSKFLYNLGYNNFDIYASNGAESPDRTVILH